MVINAVGLVGWLIVKAPFFTVTNPVFCLIYLAEHSRTQPIIYRHKK